MVEIIPKKEKKTPSLINILFYLSLLLLIITIGGYFALDYLQKDLERERVNFEKRITEKETPERKVLEKKIKEYQKRINDLSILLNAHQRSSSFFPFLEKLSHPKVFFSNLDLNLSNYEASLGGQTDNFQILGQQFLIFKTEKSIKSVNLTKISIGEEGKVEFTFKLSLDPQIFKF